MEPLITIYARDVLVWFGGFLIGTVIGYLVGWVDGRRGK